MKIAMVFDGLGYGGIEKVGKDYAKIIQTLGWELDIYNLNPSQTDMEEQFPEGISIIHRKFPRKICTEFYSRTLRMAWWGRFVYPIVWLVLSIFLRIYRILIREIPFGYTFMHKKRVRIKERKKEYDIAIAFSGHVNDLTYVAEQFVKAREKMCWLHGALYSYILIMDGFLNLYAKIKNLIVLNTDAQEEVFFANQYLDVNIKKLYNPTTIMEQELEKGKIAELKNKYGDFLLMAARFSYPHKDHYTVIDAVKILKEVHHRDVKVLFAGEGPEEEKVKTYTKKTGMGQNVVFLGNKKDIHNYYAASFIVVHASVAGEGLPTVMLEALALGKPIVATDSKVGPREILGDNQYGLLCKVQDSADMADKIEGLYVDEAKYRYYAKKGKERIEDFTVEKIKGEFLAVINELIAGVEK